MAKGGKRRDALRSGLASPHVFDRKLCVFVTLVIQAPAYPIQVLNIFIGMVFVLMTQLLKDGCFGSSSVRSDNDTGSTFGSFCYPSMFLYRMNGK